MSATFSSGKSQDEKLAGWLRIFGTAILVILFCAPVMFSQANQGTIQGGVFDQSGGAIAGAMVTVTDVARGVSRNLVADSAGQYVTPALDPGTYTVRAEAKGFRTEEHSGVLVEVGRNVRVDLLLQPGEQTQAITVTGEIPAIDTTDATLGGTVTNEAINALPLNGRNFQRLLQLHPGIVTTVGAGAGSSSTNGRRSGDDLILVDGLSTMGQATGGSLINDVYKGGDAASILPIDAIQEFNEEQNPKAEYGWKEGSVINIGVKSGTNRHSRYGIRLWARCQRHRCQQLFLDSRHISDHARDLGAVWRHGGWTHRQGQTVLVHGVRGPAGYVGRRGSRQHT